MSQRNGRISTIMPRIESERAGILQGTLDLLILRTLLTGPTHGHAIVRSIRLSSGNLLQVEHGSLYPALNRLLRKGWISAKWELSREHNRELKNYRLTPLGREQLTRERLKWSQVAIAIHRVLHNA